MQSNDAKEQKLLAALGLAMKAGRVRSGELSAQKALKSGKACLIMIDSSASDASQKRWSDACSYHGTELVVCKGVGSAIGREAHIVACVTDNGFAQMILRAHKDIES